MKTLKVPWNFIIDSMLRECRDHGSFRGPKCQYCGEEGTFLMSEANLDRFGRIMAGVLRHFPDRFDLTMDENGWVRVQEMVDSVKHRRSDIRWLKPEHIRAIVDTDPKGRYQMEAGRVRATYGHSIELDLDLPTDDVPNTLYYPAASDEAPIILDKGLYPEDRQMVHLSRTKVDALNAAQYRPGKPALIQVDARQAVTDGHKIMKAGTTVFICEHIPPQFLKPADK